MYYEHEEESGIALHSIEDEHGFDGEVPWSGTVWRWYYDRYCAHHERYEGAADSQVGRGLEAVEGEHEVQEIAEPDGEGVEEV